MEDFEIVQKAVAVGCRVGAEELGVVVCETAIDGEASMAASREDDRFTAFDRPDSTAFHVVKEDAFVLGDDRPSSWLVGEEPTVFFPNASRSSCFE